MFDTPHRLHPASIVIKFGAYFLATVKTVAAPLAAVVLSSRHSPAQVMSLAVGGGIAVVGGISLIGPVLHYLSTTFYIQDEALVIASGFVWRKRRTIPIARIQNVNVERTLWHRLLGAAAVKVETAAGSHTEGDLAALSLEDANRLQDVLLQRRGAPLEQPVESKPETLYELSPKQVFLAGALGNRILYILGSLTAVFQFEGSHKLFTPLLRYLERLSPAAALFMGTLFFVVLVAVGWLLSIGISATRFFGFRIEKHERGLLLTHGLITQFRTVVPVGRIQDVRIIEPLFFRLFGYCEIYADTAGSFDKKDIASANKICPILPEHEASRIGRLLLPEFEFESLLWQRVSAKTVGRHAVRYFFALSIPLAVPLVYFLKWHALWAIPPLAVYSFILGLISYRFVGYAFTQHIIVSRSGVFRKQAVVIPFDRIQHYTINASLFQRWQGLATLTAVSASTAGHPIHIADIDASAAERLRQTLGASIRQHLGSRRGGL